MIWNNIRCEAHRGDPGAHLPPRSSFLFGTRVEREPKYEVKAPKLKRERKRVRENKNIRRRKKRKNNNIV